jgi:hypothetical protein
MTTMSDVRIVVVTAPVGDVSLHEEVRLVKPALLYADHVTIYSPVAMLLQSAAAVALNPDLTLDLLRQIGPLLDPAVTPAFARYDELVGRKHKTPRDLQSIAGFRKLLIDGGRDIAEQVDVMIDQAGGSDLIPAIESGLLTVDPIVREDEIDQSNDDFIFDAYIARLRELLLDGHAYPLFDDQVGDLVHAAAGESAFKIGNVSRGKQASAAARFMEELPAFPDATVQEILDIRAELRDPLVRFRAAIAEMEKLIRSAAHEPDFQGEVEMIFHERVAPALLEIRELVHDNASLRRLTEAAVLDVKGILTATVTFGMTMHADMSALVAAALDVGIPVGAAAARAAWTKSEAARGIERHQLFMLYKTNKLLERG